MALAAAEEVAQQQPVVAAAADGTADSSADANPYRITAPADIARLLGELHDGRSPLKLGAPGVPAVAGRLCRVDAPQRLLGFDADAVDADADAVDQRIARLLAADRVVAAGSLDGIPLQFEALGLLRVHGGAGPATLRCAWPATLWRFQRRGAFRVRSPLAAANAPHAVWRRPLSPGDAPPARPLRVLDLSLGGCALLLPNALATGVEPGLRVDGMRLQLDAVSRIDVDLWVRHVAAEDPVAHGLRLGCEWLRLAGDDERVLQRFIDQTQRRRAFAAG